MKVTKYYTLLYFLIFIFGSMFKVFIVNSHFMRRTDDTLHSFCTSSHCTLLSPWYMLILGHKECIPVPSMVFTKLIVVAICTQWGSMGILFWNIFLFFYEHTIKEKH